LKLTYICECCDAAVAEVEIPLPHSGGTSAGLTGAVPQEEIFKAEKRGALILTTLCDDCREMVYGGPENSFFERPRLH